MEFNLKSKSVIVTGASMGFGRALAAYLVGNGSFVSICSRHENIFATRDELSKIAEKSGGKINAYKADISKEPDMCHLVESVSSQFGGIDGLVCNAGVYGPKGRIDKIDWVDWVKAIEINLIGTVMSCRSVIPEFMAKKRGKIVILSGGGATKPIPNLSAYAASKAGVVRFAETLGEELRPFGIDVNSVAPGALKTRLVEEILEAGEEKVGSQFYRDNLKVKSSESDSTEKAVQLTCFLLSELSDGITGKLISAVWDPWETLQNKVEKLSAL